MKLWASAEPIWTGDMLWAKTIREGLERVKSMLPTFPQKIGEAEAREIWRELASKAVKAGNEAGMVSTRVGGFDFPAWRLKFAVKYFKAAAKAAVAGSCMRVKPTRSTGSRPASNCRKPSSRSPAKLTNC